MESFLFYLFYIEFLTFVIFEYIYIFFSVGGKLVFQHGIYPIVWAWLSRSTKNPLGLQTPPELLMEVRSKGNVALSPLLRAGIPY